LGKNTKNRKKNARFIEKFASDMANGDWQTTGDSIKFGTDGSLIDGQHRLSACIKSDVPFRSLVIYGLDPKLRDVVDTGKPRSGGDIVTMHGIPNATSTAGLLRLIVAEREQGRKRSENAFKKVASHSEIIRTLNKHPNVALYVPSGSVMPRGVPQYMIGYINYVGSKFIDGTSDRAAAMMAVMKTGAPDYADDPMHLFRERMISGKTTPLKTSRHIVFNTLRHCYNAFQLRQPMKRLVWQTDAVVLNGLDVSQL
jgi:hypothetical protein